MKIRAWWVGWLIQGWLGLGGMHAQTVEKVYDLTFAVDGMSGAGIGSYAPLDRMVQVDSNLWFTTSKGGTYDAGSISRFDLATTSLVVVADLDNNTGKAAEGALLVISNEAFFTTLNGGNGNKGTIAKINLTNGVITVLHHFATNGLPTGATPRGGLTLIGDSLWGMTSLGGVSNRGALFRYDLSGGVCTVEADFDGPVNGGQPYDGMLQVGNAYYFTTFTGGSTFGLPGLSLGAGTLSRLSFDEGGTAVVTRLIDLPAGPTQFPANTPVLFGTNHLYFTTVGPNSNPGALVRYDLDTGYWTNEFNFITNAPHPVLYGRQPGYNGMTVWKDKLYFMTRQGGSNNTGVIACYEPAVNTVTKLADLTGTNGLALGSVSGGYNTGALVEWNHRFYFYFSTPAGGANNRGTLLRLPLEAPDLDLMVQPALAGDMQLTWVGGYAPFTVQRSSGLNAAVWEDAATGLTERAASLSVAPDYGFYRVIGSP
jgi:uncharacterized repeat protein (TIGR03803 family)